MPRKKKKDILLAFFVKYKALGDDKEFWTKAITKRFHEFSSSIEFTPELAKHRALYNSGKKENLKEKEGKRRMKEGRKRHQRKGRLMD